MERADQQAQDADCKTKEKGFWQAGECSMPGLFKLLEREMLQVSFYDYAPSFAVVLFYLVILLM